SDQSTFPASSSGAPRVPSNQCKPIPAVSIDRACRRPRLPRLVWLSRRFPSMEGREVMLNTVVIVIALSRLGCHNDESVDVTPAPPAIEAIGTGSPNPYPSYAAPSPYPGAYPTIYDPDYPDRWAMVRATICSFVLGHDPGIPTAREIEESVF